MPQHTDDERYQQLRKYVSRTNIGMFLVALLAIGLSVLLIYTGFVDGQASEMTLFGRIMGVFFAVLFALTGVLMLYVWARNAAQKPEDHPLLKAIADPSARDVVWIHPQEIRASKMKSAHLIYYYRRNGTSGSVQMPGRQQAEAILAFLAEAIPYAKIGFSKELSEAYKADPESLLS